MTRILFWINILLWSVVILLLPGCASPRAEATRETKRYADGQLIEHTKERAVIQQPSEPADKGQAEITDHGIKGVTGPAQEMDQGVALLSPLVWIGAGLIVFGVAGIAMRVWFAWLPKGASIGCIVAGVGLVAMPVLIDRYSLWLLIAIVGGASLAAAWWFGLRDNWAASKKANAPNPDPAPQPTGGAA